MECAPENDLPFQLVIEPEVGLVDGANDRRHVVKDLFPRSDDLVAARAGHIAAGNPNHQEDEREETSTHGGKQSALPRIYLTRHVRLARYFRLKLSVSGTPSKPNASRNRFAR